MIGNPHVRLLVVRLVGQSWKLPTEHVLYVYVPGSFYQLILLRCVDGDDFWHGRVSGFRGGRGGGGVHQAPQPLDDRIVGASHTAI